MKEDNTQSAAPAAVQAEPVAWRYRLFEFGRWSEWRHQGHKPQSEPTDKFVVQALYAPSPAGERQADEREALAILRELVAMDDEFATLPNPNYTPPQEVALANEARWSAWGRRKRAAWNAARALAAGGEIYCKGCGGTVAQHGPLMRCRCDHTRYCDAWPNCSPPCNVATKDRPNA